jgi:hypothetical protein
MLIFWVVTNCGLGGRYQRHYNPEDQHRHLHRCESLRATCADLNTVNSRPTRGDTILEYCAFGESGLDELNIVWD